MQDRPANQRLIPARAKKTRKLDIYSDPLAVPISPAVPQTLQGVGRSAQRDGTLSLRSALLVGYDRLLVPGPSRAVHSTVPRQFAQLRGQ